MVVIDSEERIQRYTREGWWDNRTLIEIFLENASRNPERTAIVDPLNKEEITGLHPERIKYGDLMDKVDRLSSFFLKKGVKKDDVIVIQLPNIYELLAVYLAAWRVGAIISPIPMQWRTHELERVLAVTKASVYLSTRFKGFDYLDMIEDLRYQNPQLKHIFSLDQVRTAMDEEPVDNGIEAATQSLTGNDVAVIQWTSGTEKEPKACPMSHNNWGFLRFFYRNEHRGGIMEDGYVIMNPAPLVNMTGIAVGVVPWILVSGTFVLHHPFDPVLYFRQLIEEKVNFTLGVPAVVVAMLKHPNVDSFDLSSTRLFAQGSAPPPPWTFEEFRRRWGIESMNVWGQNEGTGLFSTPEVIPELEERARSFPWSRGIKEGDIPFFKAIDNKIVDPETGKEVLEPGSVGELCFKSPLTIPRYFNQPELTEKAFDPDGYFHTGDLFKIVDSKRIAFYDRLKDIIIRGGFNISSAEIEDIVKKSPLVADVAAVGYPDERLGERVCLFIVPTGSGNVSLDEVTNIMKENDVAKYKWPERVEIVDTIPRNPVGKAQKDVLRKKISR